MMPRQTVTRLDVHGVVVKAEGKVLEANGLG